jgi:hypothetical protein
VRLTGQNLLPIGISGLLPFRRSAARCFQVRLVASPNTAPIIGGWRDLASKSSASAAS